MKNYKRTGTEVSDTLAFFSHVMSSITQLLHRPNNPETERLCRVLFASVVYYVNCKKKVTACSFILKIKSCESDKLYNIVLYCIVLLI